jgi:uracil DNA glycosylase
MYSQDCPSPSSHQQNRHPPSRTSISKSLPTCRPSSSLPLGTSHIFRTNDQQPPLTPASFTSFPTRDLSPLAQLGVLWLNTSLTVRAHKAASHSKKGWETFTAEVIRAITARENGQGVVFMAWGLPAQKTCATIGIDEVCSLLNYDIVARAGLNGLLGKTSHFEVRESSIALSIGHCIKLCENCQICAPLASFGPSRVPRERAFPPGERVALREVWRTGWN